MRRPCEQQLLRCFDVLEVVLCAEPVELVGVGVSSRARVERNFDLPENCLGPRYGTVEFPRMRHHQVHDERPLTLLGQDVVEIDVLFEIGIAHGLAPKSFVLGR